jgi:hypothetical protein
MSITLDGTLGITAPTYGGSVTAEYHVPVTTFKNRIINSGFAIDQRNAGASQTITSGAALAYTVDRWYAWTTGANGTTQRVAGTAPSQYGLKFTGATSNTLCGIAQRIEQLNSYDLASDAITISVYMTASTNTTITAVLNGPSSTADTFGTIASPTVTQIATTTFSVTTTRTLFTWTVSAASMSGFNKGLELIFKAASGLGNAVTWTVESVQLEKGSTATSFDYRPYGTELQLAQRYFETSFNVGTAVANNSSAMNIGGLTAFAVDYAQTPTISFNVSKRAAPTIAAYSSSRSGNVAGTWMYRTTGGTWTAVTSTSAYGATTQGFVMGVNLASPFTSGTSYLVEGNWTASSEL